MLLMATAFFLVTFCFAPQRGLVAQWLIRQRAQATSG
jgi:hypothetical protein